MKFMTSFDDALKLQGTSVWMKNGYTMPYFPYESGHIVFTKRIGVIPSAQQLDIKKVIKAGPPDQVDDGISHGTRQAFAVFALPSSLDLYATVIGAIDGSQEEYFSDVLFYLRRSAYHLRQLAQKHLGRHRRASSHSWNERAANPHVHRPKISRSMTPAKAIAPSPTIRPARSWTVTFVNNKATTIKTN